MGLWKSSTFYTGSEEGSTLSALMLKVNQLEGKLASLQEEPQAKSAGSQADMVLVPPRSWKMSCLAMCPWLTSSWLIHFWPRMTEKSEMEYTSTQLDNSTRELRAAMIER
jgi:hypothetical protein